MDGLRTLKRTHLLTVGDGRFLSVESHVVAFPDGAVVEASCTFDVPVRFNQAALDWQIAGKNPSRGYLWVCPGLSLIEVIGE